MKRIGFLFGLLLPLILSGCYEGKVKETVSKLQVGMTKVELDRVFKELKFLKEQAVLMYPNFTEDEMRGSFISNRHYGERHPKNVIDLLTFDGNTKVYSYLIRRQKIYANPTSVEYIAVFYNSKDDKVIGWAHMRESGDVDAWRDKF